MRVKSRQLPVVLLLASLPLLASGCSPKAAVPAPPPTADAEPLFASDEKALAAAEAAFEEYLDVAFAVFNNPTGGANALEGVAVGEVLETDTERAEKYADQGLRQASRPVTIETRLQQYVPSAGIDEVITYTCIDALSFELVNQDGQSLSDPDRAKTIVVENSFIEVGDAGLMLRESNLWSEGETCEF